MKKLLLISMLIGAMPLALMAQDDDLYFVPKKKKMIEETTERYAAQKSDAVNNDVIDFTPEQGVYPDSLEEDFKITKRMSRFDDYVLADSAAFWAGYEAGRDSWGWHSPFYYSRYGWYYPWYDPWYDPWYNPYYYTRWRYGWYDPWYYGYAGWGWSWPYYHRYYPTYVVVGGGPRHSHIGTGTIRRDGTTGSHYYGGYRGAVAGNSSRMSSLRHRAESLGGSRRTSGNTVRSGSYNNSRSTGSFSGSRSSGSFGGGSSTRSSGGSFGGGGSRGGGGGGGVRMGGRR